MGKDKISKEKRSYIMSCIKSKNTKVELLLRRALWREGYRYRIHAKLLGRPDLVFSNKKVAVFVDGDFWHGYDFKKLKPKLKNEFWLNKIKRNMERDKEVRASLKEDGWKVIRIWEHEIRNDIAASVKEIRGAL